MLPAPVTRLTHKFLFMGPFRLYPAMFGIRGAACSVNWLRHATADLSGYVNQVNRFLWPGRYGPVRSRVLQNQPLPKELKKSSGQRLVKMWAAHTSENEKESHCMGIIVSVRTAMMLFALLFDAGGAVVADEVAQPSAADYRRIAGETDTNFQKEILDKWFPRAVDERGGGFYENYELRIGRAARWGTTRASFINPRPTGASGRGLLAPRCPMTAGLYLGMKRRGAAAELMNTSLGQRSTAGFTGRSMPSGRPAGQAAVRASRFMALRSAFIRWRRATAA